jgi:hypothetical protein
MTGAIDFPGWEQSVGSESGNAWNAVCLIGSLKTTGVGFVINVGPFRYRCIVDNNNTPQGYARKRTLKLGGSSFCEGTAI